MDNIINEIGNTINEEVDELVNYTIEDFENSMTLFFYKRDGAIHSWCTGISDMRSFGAYAEDFALIIDYLILPLDRYILDNIKYFSIDLETKELCFNPPTTRYKLKKQV